MEEGLQQGLRRGVALHQPPSPLVAREKRGDSAIMTSSALGATARDKSLLLLLPARLCPPGRCCDAAAGTMARTKEGPRVAGRG